MIKYPGYKFDFYAIHGNDVSYGKEATRQVYDKLCNDMIGNILIKTRPYFIDVNVNNAFWINDRNIERFVIFVAMAIN